MEIRRRGLPSRRSHWLRPAFAMAGLAVTSAASGQGGLAPAEGGLREIVARGLPTYPWFYWGLPLVCCLLSIAVGFLLHERRVAAGIRRFPERFGWWFYWGPSLIVHLVLTLLPAIIFIYLRLVASPSLRTAYTHHGSWAPLYVLICAALPVALAMLSIRRRGGA